MRNLIRALSLAIAASLLVLLALACKSDDGSDGKTSGGLVSADPLDVLSASGERFDPDVVDALLTALRRPESGDPVASCSGAPA